MAHTEMQSENEALHTTALGTMYDPDVVYVLPLTRTFPLSLSEPISFWPARLFTNLFCAQYETRKMHEATGCLPAPFPPTRPPPIAQCPPSGQKKPDALQTNAMIATQQSRPKAATTRSGAKKIAEIPVRFLAIMQKSMPPCSLLRRPRCTYIYVSFPSSKRYL